MFVSKLKVFNKFELRLSKKFQQDVSKVAQTDHTDSFQLLTITTLKSCQLIIWILQNWFNDFLETKISFFRENNCRHDPIKMLDKLLIWNLIFSVELILLPKVLLA